MFRYKIKYFLVMLLPICLPTTVPAQTSSQRERLDYFIDHLQDWNVLVPMKFSSLNQIDDQCRSQVIQAETATTAYFEAGRYSPMGPYEEVMHLLKDLEAKESPCFKPVAFTFLFTSMIYLSYSLGFNNHQPLIANIIFLADKIEFLTPTVREKISKEQSSDGWILKDKDGHYKIQAAYDCNYSPIYLDPYQMPYDLAASMIHELSHFFFDKFMDPSAATLDPKSMVLVDETLAAVTAGFYQIVRSFMVETSPLQRNIYSRDFNMFAREGTLELMNRRIMAQSDRKLERWVFFNPLDLLTTTFLRSENQNAEPLDRDSRRLVKSGRNKIFSLISREYFGEGFDDLKDLDPDNLSEKLDPYLTFVKENAEYHKFRGPQARKDVDKFWTAIFSKSDACSKFEDHLAAGNLGNYLKPLNLLAKIPTKPGSGGVRPAGPIRPGSGGVRPTLPIRPGSGGVRPITPIRPCINMKHRL